MSVKQFEIILTSLKWKKIMPYRIASNDSSENITVGLKKNDFITALKVNSKNDCC